jgi:hypothetical protein
VRVMRLPTFVSVGCTLCAVVAVAVGCSSGGVGDGVTDDGTSAPVFGSGGSSGARGGTTNHAGAANSQAGAATGGGAGTAGAAGAGGSASKGGASGNAGNAGIGGGSAGIGGGSAGIGGGSAGTGAGGTAGMGDGAGGPGLGGGGDASGGTGGSGGAAVCGDGIIETGEQCDDTGPSETCSNTCIKVSNAACVTCENGGDCSGLVDNCVGGAAKTFSADQQTACYAVMDCVISSKCFVGTGSLGGSCYCGSLSIMACQAAPFDLSKKGAPNGPCAAVIQAGMPSVSSNSTVLGNLTANSRPAGAAMQRLNCQKTGGDGECSLPCGLASFP